MREFVVQNQFRTTLVCIDSYEKEVLNGRIYNPYLEDGIHFQSAMDFIKNMDSFLDKMNFPQSFSASRVFRPTPEINTMNTSMDVSKRGKLATFSLKVLFRQNASWQGSIMWLEENREESFRSTMELLLLMDSALSFVEK